MSEAKAKYLRDFLAELDQRRLHDLAGIPLMLVILAQLFAFDTNQRAVNGCGSSWASTPSPARPAAAADPSVLLDQFVVGECLASFLVVVHDLCRVVADERGGQSPGLVDPRSGYGGQFGDVGADVVPGGIELLRPVKVGLNTRKYGAASVPLPADPLPTVLVADARSPSTSRSHEVSRAPHCQGRWRSLTRNDAVIMRTRLCIQAVDRSWRMPASTIG